jgi:hypothetical protein
LAAGGREKGHALGGLAADVWVDRRGGVRRGGVGPGDLTSSWGIAPDFEYACGTGYYNGAVEGDLYDEAYAKRSLKKWRARTASNAVA